MEKLPKNLLIKFKSAIKNWHETVYLRQAHIDPANEIDWYDMALGFFLASGIPFEDLDYNFLCDMTNEAIKEYLELL